MKKIIILCFLTFSLFVNAQGFRGLDKSPLDMVNFPASSQVQDRFFVSYIADLNLKVET